MFVIYGANLCICSGGCTGRTHPATVLSNTILLLHRVLEWGGLPRVLALFNLHSSPILTRYLYLGVFGVERFHGGGNDGRGLFIALAAAWLAACAGVLLERMTATAGGREGRRGGRGGGDGSALSGAATERASSLCSHFFFTSIIALPHFRRRRRVLLPLQLTLRAGRHERTFSGCSSQGYNAFNAKKERVERAFAMSAFGVRIPWWFSSCSAERRIILYTAGTSYPLCTNSLCILVLLAIVSIYY